MPRLELIERESGCWRIDSDARRNETQPCSRRQQPSRADRLGDRAYILAASTFAFQEGNTKFLFYILVMAIPIGSVVAAALIAWKCR